MLLEAPQPYGLLYYPHIEHSNFLHQFRAATPPEQRKLELQPCNLDVFNFRHYSSSRDPSSQKWNYVGEKCPVNLTSRCPTSM
jgi:hypothetical protein